jgi:hypothetical protein
MDSQISNVTSLQQSIIGLHSHPTAPLDPGPVATLVAPNNSPMLPRRTASLPFPYTPLVLPPNLSRLVGKPAD